MDFDELPPIPDLDEKLKRIFNVTDICEVEERLKLNKKTAEIKKEHQSKAKAQLHKCKDKLEEVEKPTQTTEDEDTDTDLD